MHASSMENMQICVSRYLKNSPILERDSVEVIDIGGRDINGSYSDLFKDPKFTYRGVDVEDAPGVSILLDNPHKIPLPDNSVDIVLSGQMLEHCEFFWETFAEMVRVLKTDGVIFLIAPSAGPIDSAHTVDCYRFYPDAYRALAKYTACHLIDVWKDNRGPWNDLVGVFSKTNYQKNTADNSVAMQNAEDCLFKGPPWPPKEHEVTSGAAPYMNTLEFVHKALQPNNYLEIGVRTGKSLKLATCPAIGVDPLPEIKVELPKSAKLIRQGSDEFFAEVTDQFETDPIDFAFIDGMHWFEYALRDFMNIERHSHDGTVVVIDDIFPNHEAQALRKRETVFWTGDVWKLSETLKEYRPELTLIPLDCHPTGLLFITGLDRTNTVLWEQYNPIIKSYKDRHPPPPRIIKRAGALSPDSQNLKQIFQVMKMARKNNIPLNQKTKRIRELMK